MLTRLKLAVFGNPPDTINRWYKPTYSSTVSTSPRLAVSSSSLYLRSRDFGKLRAAFNARKLFNYDGLEDTARKVYMSNSGASPEPRRGIYAKRKLT
jgi:hypothetical protein